MKANHDIEAVLVYEPVDPVPIPAPEVALLSPILLEILNQFRPASDDAKLPIIA